MTWFEPAPLRRPRKCEPLSAVPIGPLNPKTEGWRSADAPTAPTAIGREGIVDSDGFSRPPRCQRVDGAPPALKAGPRRRRAQQAPDRTVRPQPGRPCRRRQPQGPGRGAVPHDGRGLRHPPRDRQPRGPHHRPSASRPRHHGPFGGRESRGKESAVSACVRFPSGRRRKPSSVESARGIRCGGTIVKTMFESRRLESVDRW